MAYYHVYYKTKSSTYYTDTGGTASLDKAQSDVAYWKSIGFDSYYAEEGASQPLTPVQQPQTNVPDPVYTPVIPAPVVPPPTPQPPAQTWLVPVEDDACGCEPSYYYWDRRYPGALWDDDDSCYLSGRCTWWRQANRWRCRFTESSSGEYYDLRPC
jgi:hypothetical protein